MRRKFNSCCPHMKTKFIKKAIIDSDTPVADNIERRIASGKSIIGETFEVERGLNLEYHGEKTVHVTNCTFKMKEKK
jgi:hypothetical protein